MKTFHDFDFVMDTQALFRAMLECIANPGRIVNIARLSSKLPVHSAHLTALGLVVLDNEVRFNTSGDGKLQESLSALTLAKPAEFQHANYIFCPLDRRASIPEAIVEAKAGTLQDPHESATFFIETDNLREGAFTELRGPGIKDAMRAPLSPAIQQALFYRDEKACRFPLGVDFFFIDSGGNLMSIPRMVRSYAA